MQTATISPIPAVRPAHIEAERLGKEIAELCSYLYAAEARLLKLIREFDAKECWAEQGFCSCAHWLNFKCGIGMNAAREKVRVARALADLPRIEAGLAKGEISYSKVRAMTRIADAGNEEYLMMIATHGTAHHVEKLVSKYRSAKRVQDAVLAEEQYRDRELSHYYDHDGCLVIKARLPAEQGALIVKALEMAMEKDFGEGSVGGRHAGDTPIAARRADALANIAETYMNNDESSGSTADRYQVVVHVTAETSEIEDGPHVTAETSRRIGCDSTVVHLREDENGEPLSIGRRSRSIPPAMRRALRNRDGGCRFPGCTNTRFVDGHHIKHWADGGETSLNNLVLLCRHHHHLVHEGGFACEKSASGEVYFKDQGQQTLPAWTGMPKVASEHELQRWLDKEFFETIDGNEGCNAKWYAGERMDWQMAVSALFTPG
ncbi:MAG: HNH endonuclease [Gammaproteobacteria bacterium]|nr:HNH endonuclease [Gammaproteobacteria bacterium]